MVFWSKCSCRRLRFTNLVGFLFLSSISLPFFNSCLHYLAFIRPDRLSSIATLTWSFGRSARVGDSGLLVLCSRSCKIQKKSILILLFFWMGGWQRGKGWEHWRCSPYVPLLSISVISLSISVFSIFSVIAQFQTILCTSTQISLQLWESNVDDCADCTEQKAEDNKVWIYICLYYITLLNYFS